MRKTWRARTTLALPAAIAVIALAAAGCSSSGSSTPKDTGTPPPSTNTSPGSPAPDALAALYAQAKTEGSLTVYGPFQSTFKPIYDEFTKAYPGVTVKTVDLFGPPLTARLQAEIATNKLGADLLASGPVDLNSYIDKGWLQSYTPPGSDTLDKAYFGPGNNYVEPLVTEAPMFYNTNKVQPNDLPKTWADLIDPKWKGKLAIPDPAQPGLSSQSLAGAEKAGVINDDWLKSLAANAQKYATVPAAIQAVATGQKEIGLVTPYQLVYFAGQQKAPIKFFTLSDGTPSTGLGYAVMAKAEHPAAAKLLSAWMLSTAGQAAIASQALQGTMPNAPAPTGGFPALAEVKILSMDLPAADLAAAQQKLTKIFGGG